MSKTLTKLQERIIARVLAEPAQTQYLRDGHVRSTQNLIAKELIDRHCYMMLQHGHLTPEVKSIFFQENDDVFAIEDIYDNCWIIFEDRKVIAKPRNDLFDEEGAGICIWEEEMDYAFPFSVDVIPGRERWLGYVPHTGVEGMLIGHRAGLGLVQGRVGPHPADPGRGNPWSGTRSHRPSSPAPTSRCRHVR
jgi:hypothetical protein